MNLLELKSIIYSIKDEFNLNGVRYYKIKKNKELFLFINKRYNNIFKSIAEIAYLIKNFDNLENIHIFCECGNKSSFINYYDGYRLFCSNKCIYCRKFKGLKISETKQNFTEDQKALAKKHYEDSMMKNHGCKHNWASKDPKLNGCATRRKRYNVDYVWASKDAELNGQAERERKYGKKHAMQVPQFVDKVVNIRKNDIDENGLNSYQRGGLKAAQTSKNNIDVNGINSCKRGVTKRKQYWLEKEGVDNYSKTQEFKDLWKDEDFVSIVMKKQYDTKRLNNSFNTSDPEDEGYLKLLTKFPDAIHHYTTDLRYPFECDFYIPSKDLFIELNFHWTHGFEPFDKNNSSHIEILNKWKSKNTKFYKIAENIWTKRDPLKLKIFKNNNLNYKIFYTEKEFNDWFDTL